MRKYLNDASFLKQIDLLQTREQYVRITVLSFDERPIASIEGNVTSGSINLDGSSSMRRTCNISFVPRQDQFINYNDVNSLLSINKKVKVVLTSGRVTNSVSEIAKIINSDKYMICDNGASIYDIEKKQTIWSKAIEKNVVCDFIADACFYRFCIKLRIRSDRFQKFDHGHHELGIVAVLHERNAGICISFHHFLNDGWSIGTICHKPIDIMFVHILRELHQCFIVSVSEERIPL